MPELPEVETVVRLLRPSLTGEELCGHTVFDPKLGHLAAERFDGMRVLEVFRSGKQIVFRLAAAGEERFLAIHLRMSGRLLWLEGENGGRGSDEGLVDRLRFVHDVSLKEAHVRLCLHGRRGTLAFADPRRFGTAVMMPDLESLEPAGLDPVGDGFTAEALERLLGSSSQPIKPWLLRQDRLVGIGNIYASEILFRAGISPRFPAASLSRSEIDRLASATRQILEAAIRSSGTTFSDFQTPDGESGGYQGLLSVYEREGEECVRCGKAVRRFVQAGRSTYFCPGCQKPRKVSKERRRKGEA